MVQVGRMAEPQTITIRPAVAADEAALGRLGELLVAVHHGFDKARFIAPDAGTRQGYGAFLAGLIGQPDAVVLVAEAGPGRVAGYVYAAVEGNDWLSLRGPAGVIYDLVVDPEHRRAGVGRRLVESALDALGALAATQIVLHTATPNTAAQKLFASVGFRSTMIEMTRDDPA